MSNAMGIIYIFTTISQESLDDKLLLVITYYHLDFVVKLLWKILYL